MSSLLIGLRSWFLEFPSDPGVGSPIASPAPAPMIVVLCRARHGSALGSAAALALADAVGSQRALLCIWPPAAGGATRWRVPALPAARRLAVALAARGLEPEATGRLVRVRLPEGPLPAAAAAARANAAAHGPMAIVLAGARPRAFDSLIEEGDAVIVAEPSPTAVAELIVRALEASRPATLACALSPGPLSGPLAAAGLLVTGAMRSRLGSMMAELT